MQQNGLVAPLPKLEDDIDAINQLNDLRDLAFQMRDEGLKSLLKAVCEKSEKRRGWIDRRKEPRDFIQPSLLFFVASRRFAVASLRSECRKVRKKALKILNRVRVTDFFPEESRKRRRRRSRVPIFQAVRVCQALMSQPKTIFSRPFWLGYYRLIRELHATTEPSWSIGGARIVDGSRPSAFMTGECARVISGLARALQDTARQFEVLSGLVQEIVRLNQLVTVPQQWKIAESNRAILASGVSYWEFGVRSILRSKASTRQHFSLEDAHPKERCGRILFGILKECDKRLRSATNGIESARSEIESFHKSELAQAKNDRVGRLRLELPHEIAFSALDAGVGVIKKLRRLQSQLLPNPSILEAKDVGDLVSHQTSRELATIADTFGEAAGRVRRLLIPARDFVNSILDRESQKKRVGLVDASELAFAAATQVSLGRSPHDPRLAAALEHFEQQISLEGYFTNTAALDTDSSGYSLHAVGSETIRAIALLIEKAVFEPPIGFIKRLLNYFDATSVSLPESAKITGWRHDHPRYPEGALEWTSALAIVGLDRVGRMLDKRINERVYRHFTVTRPNGMNRVLSLDKLIAPDFGLARYSASVPTNAKMGEFDGISVTSFFEHCRAHVLGIAGNGDYLQDCYSTILFGPPGTGKTTIVRGLAASAGVPLIEITPSDFIYEGEHFLERRSRAIFGALSAVTDTVILFDEMDEIFKKRFENKGDRQTTIYSLLRPSLLPKLDRLHTAANKQRSAYVLNTNFIEHMDEAAIRASRFDAKFGVFPPDFLSRCGAIGNAFAMTCENFSITASDVAERFRNADIILMKGVNETSNGSMPALARRGVFLELRDGDSTPSNSILGQIFGLPGATDFIPPPVEATFTKHDKDDESSVKEMTSHQKLAYFRWEMICGWDKEFGELIEEHTDSLDVRAGGQSGDVLPALVDKFEAVAGLSR